MADAINEFTLLCESCGYPLNGLPAEGRCPECGEPVAESLPERRVGSAWQRHPGILGWVMTTIHTLRSPRVLFCQVRVEPRRSMWLTVVNFSLAVAMVCAAAAPGASPAEFTALVCGGWLLLLALTAIEFLGLMFIGRRRRWRVTPTVALVVCGHASIGWIVAALLGILGGWAMGSASDAAGTQRLTLWVAAQSLPVFGFIAGMMVFETLVYIGIRRCRFANRMPPMGDA